MLLEAPSWDKHLRPRRQNTKSFAWPSSFPTNVVWHIIDLTPCRMTIAACFVSFIYGGWFLIIKWAAVGGGEDAYDCASQWFCCWEGRMCVRVCDVNKKWQWRFCHQLKLKRWIEERAVCIMQNAGFLSVFWCEVLSHIAMHRGDDGCAHSCSILK